VVHTAGLALLHPVRPHSRPMEPLGTVNVDEAPGASVQPPFENTDAGKMPGNTVVLQLFLTVNEVADAGVAAAASAAAATTTATPDVPDDRNVRCMAISSGCDVHSDCDAIVPVSRIPAWRAAVNDDSSGALTFLTANHRRAAEAATRRASPATSARRLLSLRRPTQQQNAQFGTGRFAILVKPGTYNVNVPVGYPTRSSIRRRCRARSRS
jgi:hypothetical protein